MAIRENIPSILPYFGTLFYVSKIFGIIPLSFSDFYHYKTLKLSKVGIVWVLISLVIYAVCYHFLTDKFFLDEDVNKNQGSTLTIVIGYVLMYISPAMMGVDLIVGIFNQTKLIDIFDRIRFVDERLRKENVYINNGKVRIRMNILLVVVFCGELTITSLTFFHFFDWSAWFWFISCVPLIINAVEKIWFVSLLFSLRQRFAAMNDYLDSLVDVHLSSKKINSKISDNLQMEKSGWDLGFLHQEIFLKYPAFRRPNRVISVSPWDETDPIKIGKEDLNEKTMSSTFKSDLFDMMKMEVKLNTVCQLHDEACELGKDINSMWSLQMLLLMAYGFMTITAQFYFLYCALVGQDIPVLFKSAKNITISLIYIAFTAAKCVYIIFLSWQTKTESRKSGVCLHRISLAVDENSFYEIVNHLSLKFLNHAVNFSACGFFNLDMSTLYAVTGAITSYLIILIQFNLAANRVKQSTNTTNTTAQTTELTLWNGTSVLPTINPL